MNQEELENQINQLYIQFDSETKSNSKLNLINAIIQLKISSNNNNLITNLYSDVKKFLTLSVMSIEDNRSGYYEISEKIITNVINHLSVIERISVLNFLLRELKRNGHDVKFNWINRIIKRNEIKSNWNNFKSAKIQQKIIASFKLIFNLSTYNVISILTTILIFFITYFIMLLPAFTPSFVLFNPNFVHYTDNNFKNRLLNTLMSFFGIENDFKLNPINMRGVLVTVFLKFFIVAFIINYLIEEVKFKLKK